MFFCGYFLRQRRKENTHEKWKLERRGLNGFDLPLIIGVAWLLYKKEVLDIFYSQPCTLLCTRLSF